MYSLLYVVCLLQLLIRLRESSKLLYRQSRDDRGAVVDSHHSPLIVDEVHLDVCTDSSIETTLSRVNIESVSVYVGQGSVDVSRQLLLGSLHADKRLAADDGDGGDDDVSSHYVSQSVISSTVTLLTHYEVSDDVFLVDWQLSLTAAVCSPVFLHLSLSFPLLAHQSIT